MSIHAIGDSVLQGAGHTLYDTLRLAIPGITEDAEPSRKFAAAVDLVGAVLAGPTPPATVVIALGTNGPVSAATFDAVVALGPTSRFAFVNVKVPHGWETAVNETLAAGVGAHPDRCLLVDWYAVASSYPECLNADGYHVTRHGAIVYAATLAVTLG